MTKKKRKFKGTRRLKIEKRMLEFRREERRYVDVANTPVPITTANQEGEKDRMKSLKSSTLYNRREILKIWGL